MKLGQHNLNYPQIQDVLLSLFFLLLMGGLIFFQLGVKELAPWDEGLYANIASELAAQNTFPRLFLQGQPWFEKDPLPFWFMYKSLRFWGINEFAVRFPSALFTAMLSPLFYLISRIWFKRGWAFLITLLFTLAPPLWIFHAARTGDFDTAALSLFLLTIVSYFYLRETRWWFLVGLSMAIMFLFRGIMGFLPLGVIVAAEIFKLSGTRWPKFKLANIIIISLFPWLAWQFYALLTFGLVFINSYWGEQTILRITEPIQGHVGNRFFYMAQGIKYLGSALFVMAAGVLTSLIAYFKTNDKKYAFLLIWLAITWVPLELMRTKIIWYALPMLVPLFLLMAAGTEYLASRLKNNKTQLFYSVILLTTCALYLLPWGMSLIKKLNHIQPSAFQRITADSRNYVPKGSPIVFYKNENVSPGNIWPSALWYLKYQGGLDPYIIGPGNLEYYAAKKNNYPWWIVTKDEVKKLQNLLTDNNVIITKEVSSFFLIKLQ